MSTRDERDNWGLNAPIIGETYPRNTPAAPMPPAVQPEVTTPARRSQKTRSPQLEISNIRVGAVEGWEQNLIMAGNGDPVPIQANVAYALAAAPQLSGRIWYDTFAHTIRVYGALPWDESRGPRDWSDTDLYSLISWLQGNPMINANATITRGAVHHVAHMRTYDPLCAYLDSLKWDQQPRLDTWAIRLLGAEDTPYVRAVGRKFIIAMVRRARHPGCKADNVLILGGDEGLGKSSILQALASPEFYTDEISDLGSKDAAMQMRGKWLIEMSDLETLNRVEGIRANAFFSRSTDRFRPPYGMTVVEQPRRSLLCGTTNEDEVLQHATGLRRYWIIEVSKADVAGMLAERDQLIAEAAQAETAGEPHWLNDQTLIEAQREDAQKHRVVDSWRDEIEDWLREREREELTVRLVLYHALGITDRTKWTKQFEMRVARVLKDIGYQKVHTSLGKVWRKG